MCVVCVGRGCMCVVCVGRGCMYVCVGRRCIYVCAYVCQESLHDASSNQVRGRQIRISAPVLVQCKAG